MYTIRQAAVRTGLSVATIRVWERRYGIVTPDRTPSGYRLYDDESIARLLAMRHLVAVEGWRPRQASQRILETGVEPEAWSGADAATGQGRSARSAGDRLGSIVDPLGTVVHDDRDTALTEAFVEAAHALDVPAMSRILDETFASQRFELAVERVVAPALRAIGSAWAREEIDVGAEHAASETVRRRLARFFDAAGLNGRAPRVVVGLPPQGHHEIGAFAFAVSGRRAGLDVLYLGADVPLDSWLRTLSGTGAPVAVLGIVTPSDGVSADIVIDALRSSARPPVCLIGGPLAAASSGARGVIQLPASLDDAVATVARLLGPDG